MLKKITKTAVDALTAESSDPCLWDTEVKGFGLRCRASGAKYYVLKTRIEGRQRLITIGRHGSPWTPDRARTEALRLLGLRASGKDPATERDTRKTDATVNDLADRFLAEHVVQRKATTAKDYRRAIEQVIKPKLGYHRVRAVTRQDVEQLHHDLRKHPYHANRVLAVLSKMMNVAEGWSMRPDATNPCRQVKKYRETKRERYLSGEELQRLGAALAKAARENSERPHVLAAIALLIFTGARLGEILTLRWEYVLLEEGILRLPDSKTGAKHIHLNSAAVEVLRALPRMHENPYVIAGGKEGEHLVNLEKPWRRVRKEAGLEDVRLHDLRHTYASVGAGANLALPIIGRLLGHSQPATTARYAHLAADPVKQANELIGGRIAALLNPKAPSGADEKGVDGADAGR